MFEMPDSLHTANSSCYPIPISNPPETSTGLSKRSEADIFTCISAQLLLMQKTYKKPHFAVINANIIIDIHCSGMYNILIFADQEKLIPKANSSLVFIVKYFM